LSDLAIESRGLWKIYDSNGRKIEALKGVDIRVEKGTITTILGRNGAGKTTFLRIAATQLLPTRGEIYVDGFDVIHDPWPVRERIAVIPQESRPLYFPSPLEYVKALLVMRGYSFAEADRRAREALETMSIPRDLWNRTIWSLSGGFKRRVLLAVMMGIDAEIVFLDEPSIGLDPLARRDLWSRISALRETGKTILLTTHYMEEAEALSDKVIILHQGRVIKEGAPRELVQKLGFKYKIEVTSQCQQNVLDSVGKRVGQRPPIIIYPYTSVEEALETLTKNNCRSSVLPVSLEDVFLREVGGEKWELVSEEYTGN
jgi:ABC-2 type transport system ATP-binding protein